MLKLGGIILSGGRSSRFGTDKGLFKFDRRYLVEYPIELCKSFTQDFFISANNSDYEKFGIDVIKDHYQNLGPIGGLYSALKESKHDKNLILPCDTPFITKDLIQKLVDSYNDEDVLVFNTSNGKTHPLIGIYHKRVISNLLWHIEHDKLKLIDFILSTNHRFVSLEEEDILNDCFHNLNYQSDIEKHKTIQ